MMLNIVSNIHSSERLMRLTVGSLLLISLLVGLTKWAAFLLGVGLIIEGIIGWCGLPILVKKYKLDKLFKKNTAISSETPEV